MKRFIAQSTAARPLGLPAGSKFLKVPEGLHAGRAALVYAPEPSKIALVSSDPPYAAFSSPTEPVTDAGNASFDAAVDSDGNIHLAYIAQSTGDLKYVKAVFIEGGWIPQTPVILHDVDECSHPHLAVLSNGDIWVVYTRNDSGTRYVSGKVSYDGGTSWTVASDPGDTFSPGIATDARGLMLEYKSAQYAFYVEIPGRLAYRSKPISSVLWGGEVVLGTEGNYDENFDASISPDGRLGLVYRAGTTLKFRENPGSGWSGEQNIDSGTISWPNLRYHEGDIFIFYLLTHDTGAVQSLFVRSRDGSFESPQVLDHRRNVFDRVILYSDAAGTYEDKTAEAASVHAGDVLHLSTGCLLQAEGDRVYLGSSQPFNQVRIALSTSGSGGIVNWKYFNGQVWNSFTPESGSWDFGAPRRDILLWPDYASIPDDWQKSGLSGHYHYWIEISVTTAFTAAPIGSSLTGLGNMSALILGRQS